MTTKTQGDVFVADVTIESATKAKRTVGDREITEWRMKVFVPSLGIKQYSTPVSMDVGWAEDLMAGEEHRAKLCRGRLKDNKEGKYDTDFFWDILDWGVDAEPTQASPNGHTGASGSQDEYRRSKAEMRWTEAMHMASRLTAQFEAGTDGDWVEYTIERAERLYQALEAGYPHLETPVVVEEHYCGDHSQPYIQGPAGTNGSPGRWGHRLGNSWCMEEKQQGPRCPEPEDLYDLPFQEPG